MPSRSSKSSSSGSGTSPASSNSLSLDAVGSDLVASEWDAIICGASQCDCFGKCVPISLAPTLDPDRRMKCSSTGEQRRACSTPKMIEGVLIIKGRSMGNCMIYHGHVMLVAVYAIFWLMVSKSSDGEPIVYLSVYRGFQKARSQNRQALTAPCILGIRVRARIPGRQPVYVFLIVTVGLLGFRLPFLALSFCPNERVV